MARTIIFVAEFTKSKVKTTPANAPTIDIADMLAPTASLLVSGGSPTQLTNMTGVYIYSYSAADSVLPVGLMRTADSTVDLQDVPCLPLAFDANGFLKADVEDWKGATAPAMTGDAYARLGAPAGASISADINAIPTAAEIDTELSNSHGSGTWGAGGNGGALTLTYTLTSSVDAAAIQGATVELYPTSAMNANDIIDSQVTNSLGQATFSNLTAGTYYLKRILAGWTFTNPDSESVS